jgi:hypothetical protein
VDEDYWLKLDNGSLAWEVVFVALSHLRGQPLYPSPVLSSGVLLGGSHKGNVSFPLYLTLSILEPISVLNFSNGSWSILS